MSKLKMILDETRIRAFGCGFMSYIKFYGTLIMAFVLVVAIGIGIIYKDKLKEYASTAGYPKAKMMPAQVKVSMGDTLKRLQAAIDKKCPDMKMKAGLKAADIDALVKKYGMSIPEPMKQLYMWHDGSKGPSAGTTARPEHFFTSLEGGFNFLLKVQEMNEALADKHKLPEDYYTGYLLPVYGNNSLWLQCDLRRRPEEGAYSMGFPEPFLFCFFPSLQNALTAIAECYETGAFKVGESKRKNSIHDRNSIIVDGKAWALEVDLVATKKILSKYGSFSKK